MYSLDQAQRGIRHRLKRSNLVIRPDALEPLSKIDFNQLVEVHDHEEHFLSETFFQVLKVLPRARGSKEVTEEDVQTALIMLGVAAANQRNPVLSEDTRNSIKDACGFC